MKYKIRNPFYKKEKGVEIINVFAMSIGENDMAQDNEDEVLMLMELDEDIYEYQRYQKSMFNGIDTKYGKIFKVIITENTLSSKLEFKLTKNKKVFDKFDAYHWEHID